MKSLVDSIKRKIVLIAERLGWLNRIDAIIVQNYLNNRKDGHSNQSQDIRKGSTSGKNKKPGVGP